MTSHILLSFCNKDCDYLWRANKIQRTFFVRTHLDFHCFAGRWVLSIFNVDPAFGCLLRVEVGRVADVSEECTASIFALEDGGSRFLCTVGNAAHFHMYVMRRPQSAKRDVSVPRDLTSECQEMSVCHATWPLSAKRNLLPARGLRTGSYTVCAELS
jgi:hypothetical protein